MKSVAIIGASLAGLSAARALRAQGYSGDVTIVGAESHRPYDRPPLSKEFLSGAMPEDKLALEADDDDLQALWLLGKSAIRLDATGRRIELSDGTELTTDGVVLATGARARTLPATESIAGIHVLRTLDDARALRADLLPGARLVVIGAGFIGAEVASTARALGVDVTVVEVATTPMTLQVGASMGARLAALHAEHGTILHCGVGVAGLTASAGRVTGVDLADGRHLAADIAVVGIGATPNIEWLAGSGVTTGNGVLCDLGGLTSIPSVVAAGDCAAWLDPLTGTHQRIEHWTGALERPATAVATLLAGGIHTGGLARPPYFWSDQYGTRIQFAGSTDPDDELDVEEGGPAERSFIATYRRRGQPVAVLALDHVRQFTRRRRELVSELTDIAVAHNET